jgi:putative transposase
MTLADIGKRLGRKALARVARVAKPETILAWYRKLIARKFDGSKHRGDPGRPRMAREIEALIVRFVRENSGWGYDRIAVHCGTVLSGIDFFTVELLTWRGLATYYVLFLIQCMNSASLTFVPRGKVPAF